MSVIICEQDMQLKVINKNKLKPQNLLFEKHTLFFPAVALFLHLCTYSVLPLPSSALWFFFQLEKDCSHCRSVCCTACRGKSKRAGVAFLLPAVLMVWGKGGRTNMAVLAPCCPGMCQPVARLTPGDPCAPVSQVKSPLCCEQKAVWWDSLKI